MTGFGLPSESSAAPLAPTGLAQYGQSLRLARKLIAQTLRYFADREDDVLQYMRAHLRGLVDARPPLAQSQIFRSVHTLLGNFGAEFHGALQAALSEVLATVLTSALPEPAKNRRASGALGRWAAGSGPQPDGYGRHRAHSAAESDGPAAGAVVGQRIDVG